MAIKVLNSFRLHSKLVWNCHQSLVKLAEHNRIWLAWVPGNIGIDGNEEADQLARHYFSCQLVGPEPALGISTKVARGVCRDWKSRKHEEHWQSTCGQRQAKGFFNIPSAERAGELRLSKLANSSDRATNEHCHLNRPRKSQVWWIPTGIGNCAAHSLWLWHVSHIKI